MLKLCVIGKDVSQSQSPQMHAFLLEKMGVRCEYTAVSIPPAQFAARAEELFSAYDGFNVTIPFKTDIIPFLSSLEGDAETFGAVNTVRAGERKGYNTDGLGFLLMLENEGVAVEGKSVLVLGAGGAGRSCSRKLTERGAEVFAYERDGERLRRVYDEFGGFTPLSAVGPRRYDIVLNCTGIGMHDTVGKTPSVRTAHGEAPVGEELLSRADTAVDLIYVPDRSEFLRIAASLGKKTVNGAAMLFYQAYYADCIYLNRTPSAAEAKAYFIQYQGGKA